MMPYTAYPFDNTTRQIRAILAVTPVINAFFITLLAGDLNHSGDNGVYLRVRIEGYNGSVNSRAAKASVMAGERSAESPCKPEW